MAKFTLVVNVDVDLNGVSSKDICENLIALVERGMGEGAITLDSEAEVNSWEANVTPETQRDFQVGYARCPIFDCEGRSMNVGDKFSYQAGMPWASVVTIYLKDGVEWLSFSDSTADISLADFWYAPTDELISRKLDK